MPSGYTAKLHDEEQSFEEFAMTCARAFGALVMMREEPLDAEIPTEFKPSSYAQNQLDKANEELPRIRSLTDAQCEAEAKREHDEEMKSWREAREKALARRDRYMEMRERVLGWEPPTDEHTGLKKMMLEQIDQSLRPDCQYAIERDEPTLLSAEQWRRQQIEFWEKQLSYYEKSGEEEVQRAKERTEWVQQLRDSLGVPA